MFDFFSDFQKEKVTCLKKLHLEFAEPMLKLHTIENFKELDNEQYEHIEQSQEYEEVMKERITELEKIIEEQADQEGEDEDEFLSFFKGGVPHDKRSFFYENFEETFLDRSSVIFFL